MNSKNDITEGIIWKQILLFFFPILIGTFFQQLYNTVDAVVVGRFAGKEALSCVSGSSAQFVNFIVGFFTGLSAGSTVVISQFFGAKDQKRLDSALHTSYAFACIGGILFGILGIFMAPSILTLMNTPDELMDGSLLYLRVYFAGLVFVFIYNIGSSILRAIGDSRRPLYILMICCGINIILDVLFVCLFHMSVLGAAIATLLSQAVSSVLITYLLIYHTPELTLRLKNIRIEKNILSQILRIGFPSGIQSSMYNISNIIIQTALNAFGVNTVAAWGALGKIDSLIWMVYGAFSIAVTTFVGQNYGAGKYDRIRKGTVVTFAMCFTAIGAITVFLVTFAEPLLSIFTTDTQVTSIGITMLNLLSKGYIAYTFVQIFAAVLQAEGTVMIPTLITLCGTCIFRIVWIKIIVPDGSLTQIISCYPLTWVTCAILFIFYFAWKQKKILNRY